MIIPFSVFLALSYRSSFARAVSLQPSLRSFLALPSLSLSFSLHLRFSTALPCFSPCRLVSVNHSVAFTPAGNTLMTLFSPLRPLHLPVLQMYNEVSAVLWAAGKHDDVAGVVLASSGRIFSSGQDLREVAERLQAAHMSPSSSTLRTESLPGRTGLSARTAPVSQFMLAVLRFPKLLAACVQGPAIGIGATLLAHCDVVYAAPTATLSTPL